MVWAAHWVFEGPVQDLIDELGKLPGIGPKSAQRIAFHLLSVEPPDIDRLTAVLANGDEIQIGHYRLVFLTGPSETGPR